MALLGRCDFALKQMLIRLKELSAFAATHPALSYPNLGGIKCKSSFAMWAPSYELHVDWLFAN
jgi:hypothetical protein